MWRRGISTCIGSMAVLALTQMISQAAYAQSVIQRPSCFGIIQGIVSQHKGQPVRGFGVVAWPVGIGVGGPLPTTRTDESGRYRFRNVCVGRYTVLPQDEKTGYPRMNPNLYEFLYGRPVEEITITTKNNQADLNVKLPPKPGLMQVHIKDTSNAEVRTFTINLKIPNQKYANEMQFLFFPDVKDREIEVPPGKDFRVEVVADGFRNWTGDSTEHTLLSVPPGAHANLDARLEPLK